MSCRFKLHRGGWGRTRTKKYPNTKFSDGLIRERYDGKIYGRAAEIAGQLGWPTWAVKKQAARLGLCYPQDRKDWSPAEVKFLEQWRGARPADWIARKLRRSLTSVVLKFKRLGISRRVHQGYTLRMLGACFGVDHKTIESWVRKGCFRMEYGLPAGPSRRWKVSETAVFEFIWQHPTAFRLDKVDQPWFMGLMQRSLQAALRIPHVGGAASGVVRVNQGRAVARAELRSLRQSMALTQGEAAGIVGLAKSTIAVYECGQGNVTAARITELIDRLREWGERNGRPAVTPTTIGSASPGPSAETLPPSGVPRYVPAPPRTTPKVRVRSCPLPRGAVDEDELCLCGSARRRHDALKYSCQVCRRGGSGCQFFRSASRFNGAG